MIEIIQKAIKQGIDNAGLVGVMEGEVVSAPPNLKIKLKNNSKLIIPKELLVVPQKLTDYTLQCSIAVDSAVATSSSISGIAQSNEYLPSTITSGAVSLNNFNTEGGEITIKNSLKSGDKVMLVSFEGGQRFYILDRI